MYGNFESVVGIEIDAGDYSHEMVFTVALKCTARSIPEDRTDPYAAPEFEVTAVHLLHPDTNQLLTTFSVDAFYALVGYDIAGEIFERAGIKAEWSREF